MGGAGKARRQRLIPSFAGVGNGLCHGRQRPLKQFPNLLISGFFGQDLVASENAPRIAVHHEDRMVASVEQDGIGSFGADAMQIEEFFPKLFRRARK